MKIRLKHAGWSSVSGHRYLVLTDNGHADIIYEHDFISDGEYDTDDRLWIEGSGWANLQCDSCEHYRRERVYPGLEVKCPVCDATEIIPSGLTLDDTND